MQANAAGYGFLKLFPAVAVGGVNLLKALAGPSRMWPSAPPAASRPRPRRSS
jgi:2-keto-3-deoxy-6-phosphogluconate aldolase